MLFAWAIASCTGPDADEDDEPAEEEVAGAEEDVIARKRETARASPCGPSISSTSISFSAPVSAMIRCGRFARRTISYWPGALTTAGPSNGWIVVSTTSA